jgi:hypothetical protein
MPRRNLLIASATALPLLFGTAGCHSGDLFAGPDPLGSAPPLAHDTVVLQAVIAAEERLVALYESVLAGSRRSGSGGGGAVLSSLLAQHRQHLAELKGWLIVPPGAAASRSPSATAFPSPSPSVGGPDPIALLRAAERDSAATLVRQLTAVEPALAQLFASIAASDVTHVTALASVGR